MKKIFAYTDGSASVRGENAGKGGFGTYFPNLNGKPMAFSLGYKNTKTGAMEVTALHYAIAAIDPSLECKLIVYSDSEYVVKSFTENRLERWAKNDWISYGSTIKNKELWQSIWKMLGQRNKMKIELRHIKSHQLEKEKNPDKLEKLKQNPHIIGNAMADRLADYKRFEIYL